MQLADTHFVALQYGDITSDLDTLAPDLRGRLHLPEVDVTGDIDGLAALVSALDLVISADNSTVHLAGALGTETWVVLPKLADWRWMQERTDTPWYSSVRLYRNRTVEDWSGVFEQLLHDLKTRIAI